MAESVDRLAEDVRAWRNASAPDSGDDLPRLERAMGWTPDWSASAVAERQSMLAALADRHAALDVSTADVATRVDAAIVGCVLARSRWELDVLRAWQRNPAFYLDQALGGIYQLLLPPPPVDAERIAAVVCHLGGVAGVLAGARVNLAGHLVDPFVRPALLACNRAATALPSAMRALAAQVPARSAEALPAASSAAVAAIAKFADWLRTEPSQGSRPTAIGADGLAQFVYEVALIPYSVDELRAVARAEFNRASFASAVGGLQASKAGSGTLLPDLAAQIARQRRDERGLRRTLAKLGVLELPADLRHYAFAPMPDYLVPLTWLGVAHHLGGPSRPDDDAIRWVRPPATGLPYFERAKALDPRTGILHEGVHAWQAALGWRHPRPARRTFVDSTPNEGIAFHFETLALELGLLEDSPASVEFLQSSQRLRALRVEVDIALALGEADIDDAAALLVERGGLDADSAMQEATLFASNPGQGMSYLVGHLQVLDLLAGDGGTELALFYNRLLQEGNVPLALQQWELLGDRRPLDDVARLRAEALG